MFRKGMKSRALHIPDVRAERGERKKRSDPEKDMEAKAVRESGV